MPRVAIIMGSKSDWEYMKEAYELFKSFDIDVEVKVISAHRTPEYAFSFGKDAKNKGV
jgi:5-(carboxyamino)imidazole ribonucleotide mutase